jgi:hypothetical protein
MFDDLTTNEITRESKILLYTIKDLNEFVEKGIMEGKAFEITDEGLNVLEGFEPTEEEIKMGLQTLRDLGYL